MHFLDQAKIYVKSGAGGPGAVSFRREKYVEYGGPDGGNGGKGGDIVFEAVQGLNTLIDFRYTQHFKAARGGHGMGKDRTGASAPDLVIQVPVGTQVLSEDKEEVLADFTEVGQRITLLEGGMGGRGNASYKTSTNRAPRQMTVVYNYFAMPPARAEFCQAALQVAAAQAAMPKADAAALAAANFVQFEVPFENFFTAYEQYQRDSAAWDARYGARYGASQPGYVAVHGSGMMNVPQAGVANAAATTTQPVVQAGAVTDAETGAVIPVLTVPQTEQSVPVVQPVAKDAPKQ